MNTLYKTINIAGKPINGNILLAPLAGYTDAAFRSLCIEYGAALGFTEMISAEAVYRGSIKTLELIRRGDNERDFGIQMFTSSIEAAVSCAQVIEKEAPFIIDINCGCSVPKILKSGAGAALLQKPRFIGELVKALVNTVSIPVSVKLRLGWDIHSISYLEAAEAAVRNGASMVSLHPRTRSQGFTGKADWTHLAELKKHISVPVIGSGDLFTPEDAEKMLRETHIDGVMFARGAIGNPFIFSRTKSLLNGDDPVSGNPSAATRLSAALSQLKMMCAYKPENVACREMRKHIAHYVKGLFGASEIRHRINSIETIREYEAMMNGFLARHLDQ